MQQRSTFDAKSLFLMMMLYALVTLATCLAAAQAREINKPFKTMPTISNSLVNLGKMGISFYFNSKVPESSMDANPNFYSKPESENEGAVCPCMKNKNKNSNSPFPSPGDILSKIMATEAASSMACCDSHERVQEDTVYFEIGPKQGHTDLLNSNPIQPNPLPMLPIIFENLLPNKQPNLPAMPIKPKAIEIFFFPKKKDNLAQEMNAKLFPKKKENAVKKSDIQIVGDKELRNDFKTFKYRPIPPMSSIKKDLTAVEKSENAITTTTEPSTEDPPTTYTSGNTI